MPHKHTTLGPRSVLALADRPARRRRSWPQRRAAAAATAATDAAAATAATDAALPAAILFAGEVYAPLVPLPLALLPYTHLRVRRTGCGQEWVQTMQGKQSRVAGQCGTQTKRREANASSTQY